MKSRQDLQVEFIELRNAQMKRGTSTRTRNIYFDWLNESDKLAEIKSDEELVKDIERMKQ